MHRTPFFRRSRKAHTSCSTNAKHYVRRKEKSKGMPFSVSRFDLAWGSSPWSFKQSAVLENLNLNLPSLMDSSTHVDVTFKIEKSRGLNGLYVNGRVQAVLKRRCDRCWSELPDYFCDAGFEAWLNAEVSSESDITSAYEVAFPDTENVCDLTQLVADCILETQPSVVKCERRECDESFHRLQLREEQRATAGVFDKLSKLKKSSKDFLV